MIEPGKRQCLRCGEMFETENKDGEQCPSCENEMNADFQDCFWSEMESMEY